MDLLGTAPIAQKQGQVLYVSNKLKKKSLAGCFFSKSARCSKNTLHIMKYKVKC